MLVLYCIVLALLSSLNFHTNFILFYLLIYAHVTWHSRSQFPDQGQNLKPLHWKLGILITGPPGKSLHMNFQNQAVKFCKDVTWNFDRDCIESKDQFGQYCHPNIKSSMSFYLFHSFKKFFQQYFVSFRICFTFLLKKIILKYFVIFDAVVN